MEHRALVQTPSTAPGALGTSQSCSHHGFVGDSPQDPHGTVLGGTQHPAHSAGEGTQQGGDVTSHIVCVPGIPEQPCVATAT